MQTKQNKNSIFATLPGFLCLLLFSVVAVYFKAGELAVFLVFILLLHLFSILWSRSSVKHVSVSLSSGDIRGYAGRSVALTTTVMNHGLLPVIWLDIMIVLPKTDFLSQSGEASSICFLKGEEKAVPCLSQRCSLIPWKQELEFTEILKANHRGILFLDKVFLQAGDGIGLAACSQSCRLDKSKKIIIYPSVCPIDASPFLRHTQNAAARRGGTEEDITLLKNIRPYQTGDNMKRINWRMLAASGKMYTNQYETVLPGCSSFILDPGLFRYFTEEENGNGQTYRIPHMLSEELEEAISLTASCIKELTEKKQLTALLIPSFDGHPARIIRSHSDSEMEEVFLDELEELAGLTYHTEDTVFPLDEFMEIHQKLGTIYCLVPDDSSTPFASLTAADERILLRYLALKQTGSNTPDHLFLYADAVRLTGTL